MKRVFSYLITSLFVLGFALGAVGCSGDLMDVPKPGRFAEEPGKNFYIYGGTGAKQMTKDGTDNDGNDKYSADYSYTGCGWGSDKGYVRFCITYTSQNSIDGGVWDPPNGMNAARWGQNADTPSKSDAIAIGKEKELTKTTVGVAGNNILLSGLDMGKTYKISFVPNTNKISTAASASLAVNLDFTMEKFLDTIVGAATGDDLATKKSNAKAAVDANCAWGAYGTQMTALKTAIDAAADDKEIASAVNDAKTATETAFKGSNKTFKNNLSFSLGGGDGSFASEFQAAADEDIKFILKNAQTGLYWGLASEAITSAVDAVDGQSHLVGCDLTIGEKLPTMLTVKKEYVYNLKFTSSTGNIQASKKHLFDGAKLVGNFGSKDEYRRPITDEAINIDNKGNCTFTPKGTSVSFYIDMNRPFHDADGNAYGANATFTSSTPVAVNDDGTLTCSTAGAKTMLTITGLTVGKLHQITLTPNASNVATDNAKIKCVKLYDYYAPGLGSGWNFDDTTGFSLVDGKTDEWVLAIISAQTNTGFKITDSPNWTGNEVFKNSAVNATNNNLETNAKVTEAGDGSSGDATLTCSVNSVLHIKKNGDGKMTAWVTGA